jgi:zinc transporter 9
MAHGAHGERVVLSAILGNGLIAVAKLFGWFVSRSPSLLAEGIHSIADTSNQFLLWIGIHHGRRGPSREFPYGQASARYLWNLVSAVGIFFIGFGVTTYHGVAALLGGHGPAEAAGALTYSILGLALVIEGAVLAYAVRAVWRDKGERSLWQHIRTSDDPTTVAVLLEDSIAVLGVLVAAAGISLSALLHSPIPDAVGSIIIGLLLGLMAILLAILNGRFLIGSAVDVATEDEIRAFVSQEPTVEKVVSLKTRVLGPGKIRLSMEVEFHAGMLVDPRLVARAADEIRSGTEAAPRILTRMARRTGRKLGREINRLETRIQERFPEVASIDLEVN